VRSATVDLFGKADVCQALFGALGDIFCHPDLARQDRHLMVFDPDGFVGVPEVLGLGAEFLATGVGDRFLESGELGGGSSE